MASEDRQQGSTQFLASDPAQQANSAITLSSDTKGSSTEIYDPDALDDNPSVADNKGVLRKVLYGLIAFLVVAVVIGVVLYFTLGHKSAEESVATSAASNGEVSAKETQFQYPPTAELSDFTLNEDVDPCDDLYAHVCRNAMSAYISEGTDMPISIASAGAIALVEIRRLVAGIADDTTTYDIGEKSFTTDVSKFWSSVRQFKQQPDKEGLREHIVYGVETTPATLQDFWVAMETRQLDGYTAPMLLVHDDRIISTEDAFLTFTNNVGDDHGLVGTLKLTRPESIMSETMKFTNDQLESNIATMTAHLLALGVCASDAEARSVAEQAQAYWTLYRSNFMKENGIEEFENRLDLSTHDIDTAEISEIAILADLIAQYTSLDIEGYIQATHPGIDYDAHTERISIDRTHLNALNTTVASSTVEQLRAVSITKAAKVLCTLVDCADETLPFKLDTKVYSDKPVYDADLAIYQPVLEVQSSLVYASQYEGSTSELEIIDTTQGIREAYIRIFNTSTYVTTDVGREALMSKMAGLNVMVGPSKASHLQAINLFLTDPITDSWQTAFNLTSDGFFDNLHKLGRAGITYAANTYKLPYRDFNSVPIPSFMGNAVYDSHQNGIFIPTATYSVPTAAHNPAWSIATRIGGFGSVLAHEIGHSVDTTNIQWDVNGTYTGDMVAVLDNTTLNSYEERAVCLAEKYSSYPNPYYSEDVVSDYSISEHVDGEYTLGENAADNAGVEAAYEYFRTWLAEGNGVDANQTESELMKEFWIGYARVWCTYTSEASLDAELETGFTLRDSTESNEHAPPNVRVLGTVSNQEAFSTVYECPINATMNPSHRCHIWKST